MSTFSVRNTSCRLNRITACSIAVLCILTTLATAAWCQDKLVDVRLISPSLVETQPGRIVTTSFSVTNNAPSTEVFIEDLQLPEDWQTVIPATRFTLSCAASAPRIMAIQIPPGCPAGMYEIRYAVQGENNPGLRDFATVKILVQATRKLTLMVEDNPERVIAGETYQTQVRLVNNSNTTERVNLVAAIAQRLYKASIQPSSITLSPGMSQMAVLSISTDKRETRSQVHLVQVKAFPVGTSIRESLAAVNLTFSVVPRLSSGGRVRTIPAKVGYRITGDNSGRRPGMQACISGAGSLSDDDKQRIDFQLRAPSTHSDGSFGLYDEYRINYENKDTRVRLGDQIYGLSYLTDYYHYGRGVGVDIRRPNDIGIGAYYQKPRWQVLDRAVAGIYVSKKFDGNGLLKLNMLTNSELSDDGDDRYRDSVYSLEAILHPTDTSNIHVEYGNSTSDRPGYAKDSAYRVELNSRPSPNVAMTYQTTHAGPDYTGYYRDRDYTVGSAIFNVNDRLRTGLYYSTYRQNIALRTCQPTAPREELFQADLNYQLADKWYTSLAYGYMSRRDTLAPADYDYIDRPLTLGIGHTESQTSWLFEYRNGTRTDNITHHSSMAQEYKMLATWRPSPRQFFSIHGSICSDDQGGFLLNSGNQFGFSAEFRPTDDLYLSAWYNRYSYSDERPDSNQANLMVKYNLPLDRTISLSILQSDQAYDGHGTSYELVYTLPFNMPVGRKDDNVSIQGRVFDAESPGKTGIEKAIVTLNGSNLITGKNGEFSFSRLTAGEYYLSLDRASIGLDRTTQEMTPVYIKVVSPEKRSVDIGVVRASSLRGRVIVMPPSDPTGTNASGDAGVVIANGQVLQGGSTVTQSPIRGLANILVQISQGGEAIRRITDSNGDFQIDGLRPGNWHVKVSDNNLPTYHYLEQPEMDVQLSPGQENAITVKVLPRLRTVKIVNQGVIVGH